MRIPGGTMMLLLLTYPQQPLLLRPFLSIAYMYVYDQVCTSRSVCICSQFFYPSIIEKHPLPPIAILFSYLPLHISSPKANLNSPYHHVLAPSRSYCLW
ncbi:hypothetical protein F5B17DRAFT_141284 [Nemania serpens]|nr:hypothetical protein F5B17DRAFT_141284 [Nemania serpens]